MQKITAGYNSWRILWRSVAQYQRSMRGALVILSVSLGSCAGSIPDKDVRSFSDAELLLAYGSLVRDNSQGKRNIYPFEQEVQNRQLLNVREVDDIQNNVVHVGMRSAVVLATFGEPFAVISNQNDRGLQVWRYLNALPSLFPVNIQATNGDRIFWTIANPSSNEFAGLQVFMRNGVAVGLTVTTNHREKNDLIDMLYFARSGKTLYVPVEVNSPWLLEGCLFLIHCHYQNLSVR